MMASNGLKRSFASGRNWSRPEAKFRVRAEAGIPYVGQRMVSPRFESDLVSSEKRVRHRGGRRKGKGCRPTPTHGEADETANAEFRSSPECELRINQGARPEYNNTNQ